MHVGGACRLHGDAVGGKRPWGLKTWKLPVLMAGPVRAGRISRPVQSPEAEHLELFDDRLGGVGAAHPQQRDLLPRRQKNLARPRLVGPSSRTGEGAGA